MGIEDILEHVVQLLGFMMISHFTPLIGIASDKSIIYG